MATTSLDHWFYLISLPMYIVLLTGGLAQAVNYNRYDKLDREEFLELDREVTRYYDETYEKLDLSNYTYEEQIFKAIRAHRHTIVINHYEYAYTDDEVMNNSLGSKVDRLLCETQLTTMVQMAKLSIKDRPMSSINFFESNGRTGSGILNGNFVWLGSYETCKRARIPAGSAHKFTNDSNQVARSHDEDIVGRYCVAHLKAKSWPRWDKYFEERIRIRVGVCLPESCHTPSYLGSEEVRKAVDFLSRHTLTEPFNGDKYEITYLYCLPDEDSPYRQWDLGAKLFIAFTLFWSAVLVYTNWHYYKRMRTVQKLRESVDIRMIISERRASSDDESGDNGEATVSDDETGDGQRKLGTGDKQGEPGSRLATQQQQQQQATLKVTDERSPSRLSSAQVSEIEDNDGDFNVIRTVVVNRLAKNARKSRPSSDSASKQSGIDYIKAFSIQSNLNYLLNGRDGESQARKSDDVAAGNSPPAFRAQEHQRTGSRSQQIGVNSTRLSQQLSAVNRRTSASNEALIKDLQQNEEGESAKRSKVAIVSGNADREARQRSKPGSLASEKGSTDRKRVDMDIFDGIKVFSTIYIVHGHVLMFFFGIVTDLRFSDERMLDFTLITVFNTLHVVSLFYILTGILLTYLAFSRQEPKQLVQPQFWLLVIVGRYIRLLPTYLLVFWFARHVAPFTGSGPMWFDYRTDSEHVRGYCATESWWTMLTMSAADIKIPLDCVPQSWYLSNDFRTLLILPIYIVLLAKNRTAGYAAIFGTFIFSWARLTHILRKANIDYKVLATWKPHVYSILADRLHDVYTDLMVRVSTYLLGVLVGHLLYLYEIREIKEWPKWLRRSGMKISLVIGSIFFMGAPLLANPLLNQFLPSVDEMGSDTMAVLIPVFKTFMEMCFCVVLMLLVTGGGYSILNRFLSCHLLKILANISYGVFLIHIEVMYKVKTVRFESSYWQLFIHSSFFILFSNILAFFIHLLYEMPINNLLRYVFRRMLKAIVK